MELKHIDRPLNVETIGEDGLFEGYASIFNAPDSGKDIVLPGAFKDSLAAHRRAGTMPKMLWQHDPREPLGVWLDMREDGRGLRVKGRLLIGEIRRAAEAKALMMAGAVDGLSIGYTVVESERDAKTGLRRLIKVDLWEASVVSFPMNGQARVASVKEAFAAGRLPGKRDFERFLREAGGLSRQQAKGLIARGYDGVRPREADETADHLETINLIRAVTAQISGDQHG